MPELATAWITLAATTRGMESDVRRALERAERSAKLNPTVDVSALSSQGSRAGREFAQRFSAEGGRGGASGGQSAGAAFVKSFGAVMAGGALVGIAAKAADSVVDEFKRVFSVGLDFSKTMNNFQGVTRATTAEMTQMKLAARALGSDTTLAGTSSADAASAMTELAKAGFNVDQAMGSARGTLQLATAGQIEAAKAAEIQSNAMNAFDMPKGLETAAHVADLLANAAVASSADIPDLGEALQQVGGIAHGFGENLDDTVAALGMFANAGVKGSDAGTLLKTTMQSITDQGNPAQGAIESLGLSLYKLNAQGDKQFVGFRELFRQLDEAKRRMSSESFQADTNILFGSDAMRSAMLGNAQSFDDMLGKLERVGGAAELADAQMQGLPGAVESFSNAVEGIRLDVFDGIGNAVAGPLGEFVKYLSDHKADVVQFFTTVGSAAIDMARYVAASVSGATTALGALADAFGMDETARSLRFAAGASKEAFDSLSNAQNMLTQYSARAQESAKFTTALGNSVKTLKTVGDDVTIDVKENTPEVRDKLAKLGAHLEQMSNDPTKLKIVPDTQTADNAINAFRQQQQGTPINVPFGVHYQEGQSFLPEWFKYIGGQAGPATLPVTATISAPPVPGIQGAPTPSVAPTLGGIPFGGSPASPPTLGGLPFIPPKPRAAGGLFGSMPTDAVIQPATAGLIQWAEPSTGGEAFIPLAGGNRSIDIWAQTGRLLGAFDQGGFTGIDAALLSRVPAGRYNASGDLAKGLGDCSSAVEDLVNILDGQSTAGRSMSTGNAVQWLTDHGFSPGEGAPGDFRVGFNSAHMQATLPDGTPFNWGSDSAAANRGIGGSGADDPAFTSHFHRSMGALSSLHEGSYDAPDPKQVREAEERVVDADRRLAIQQQQLTELKADASKSQRMQQEADVDKAKREAADARADLEEAKRGKFREGRSGRSGGGSDDGRFTSLGQGLFSGFADALGVPNFANLLEMPNFKSAMAGLNFGLGLLTPGREGGVGPDGGGPLGGALGSIGLPNLAGVMQPTAMQPLQLPNATHMGTGQLPGSGNFIVNGNVGMDPKALTDQFSHKQNEAYRKNMAAVRPG